MKSLKRNGVVILGAPRSGISTLSGCLHLLGTKFGFLHEPGKGKLQHPKYFQEEVELVHDLLFRDLEVHWDMVGALPKGWQSVKAADQAKQKLIHIWERHFKGAHLWAVNDPRMCRLMPLWNSVFSELGIDPAVIFISRNPKEVAASLNEHNHIEPAQGELLWLTYNREALAACRESRHLLITYDQLLADPIATLENLSNRLQFNYPRSIRRHAQKILHFVRAEKKHHHASSFEETSEEQRDPYVWLFDQLRMRQILTKPPIENSVEEVSTDIEMVQDRDNGVLPILTTTPDLQPPSERSGGVTGMFSSLLDRIGEYERQERSLELKKEQRLLEDTQLENVIFCRMLVQDEDPGESITRIRPEHIRALPNGEWVQTSFQLPSQDRELSAPIRFVLSNQVSLVTVSALNLIDVSRNETIWSANSENQFQNCTLEGTAFQLNDKDGLQIVSTGNKPLISLSPTGIDLPDCPVRFDLWIKVDRTFSNLQALWTDQEKYTKKLFHDRRTLRIEKEEWDNLEEQFRQDLTAIQDRLQEERKKWETERDAQKQEEQELKKLINELQESISEEKSSKLKSEKELARMQIRFEDVQKKRKAEQDSLQKETRTLGSQLSELQKENEEEIKAKKQLEEELARIQVRLEDVQKKRKAEQDSLQKETRTLGSQLSELQKENEEEIKAKKQLEEELARMQVRLEDVQKKRKAEQDSLQKETRTLGSQLSELQKENEEEIKAKKQLEEELARMQVRLEDVQKKRKAEQDSLQKETRTLGSQLSELQKENEEEIKAKKQLAKELAKIQRRLAEVQKKRKAEQDSLKRENQDLSTQIDGFQKERETWNKERAQLERNLEKVKLQLAGEKENRKTDKDSFKKEAQKLNKQLRSLQREKDQWDKQKSQFEKDLERVTQELLSRKTELNESNREASALTKQIDALQDQLNRNNDTLKDAEKSWLEEKNQLQSHLEDLRENELRLNTQHHNESADKDLRIQALSRQVEQYKGLLEDQELRNKALDKQFQAQQEKLDSLKAELRRSLLPRK